MLSAPRGCFGEFLDLLGKDTRRGGIVLLDVGDVAHPIERLGRGVRHRRDGCRHRRGRRRWLRHIGRAPANSSPPSKNWRLSLPTAAAEDGADEKACDGGPVFRRQRAQRAGAAAQAGGIGIGLDRRRLPRRASTPAAQPDGTRSGCRRRRRSRPLRIGAQLLRRDRADAIGEFAVLLLSIRLFIWASWLPKSSVAPVARARASVRLCTRSVRLRSCALESGSGSGALRLQLLQQGGVGAGSGCPGRPHVPSRPRPPRRWDRKG